MILSTANFAFLLLVTRVEALPFSNTNFYPTGVRRVFQNLHSPYADQHSSLRVPLRGSSGVFSGHGGSSIGRPSLRLADTLRRIRERSPLILRPMTLTNGASSRYLNGPRQEFETAKNIERFGQQVRDSVENYKKGRVQATQQANELFDRRFNLGEAKDRLREAFLGKKALMEKLHSIGWRGKYVGVPYHTMNDEHAIVKKPGADFGLFSESRFGVPALSPVPGIESIRPEHPAVPEATTSVGGEQVLENPAAAYSFMFPITPTSGVFPKTILDNNASESAISIGNYGFTATHLPSNVSDQTDAEIFITPSTHTTTGSGILELIANRISFNEIKEPTEEAGVSFKSENEAITGSTIDSEITMGIVSTLVSAPSGAVTTSEADATPSMPSTYQTTTPLDVLFEIHSDHGINSVAESDIMTTETPSTYSFTTAETVYVTIDEEFTSSTTNAGTTVGIISNFSTDLLTEKNSNDETTSSEPSASLTTTMTNETSSTIDDAKSAIETDTTAEDFSTYSSTESTERVSNSFEITKITNIPFYSSATDGETTVEYGSTHSSTVLSTTITEENEMSTISSIPSASSITDPETTNEITAIVWDSTVSTATPDLDGTSTIANTAVKRSTVDVNTTTERYSSSVFTGATEQALEFDEITATVSTPVESSTPNVETTTEFVSTYFSETPNEQTSTSEEIFTTNIPFTSSTIDMESTNEITSTSRDFTVTAETTNFDERPTTASILFGEAATNSDTTTENSVTYFSTESTVTIGTSTITISPSYNSITNAETTVEIVSTDSSTESSHITTNPNYLLSEIMSTPLAGSTIDTETTTEVTSTVQDSTLFTETPYSDVTSTIVDITAAKLAIDIDTTTEEFATYTSTEPTDRIVTTASSSFTSSTTDAETTTDSNSTDSSWISNETSFTSDGIFTTSAFWETTQGPSSTDSESTVPTLIANLDETSTVANTAVERVPFDVDTTTENFSSYSSTVATEEVSNFDEIATTTAGTPGISLTIDFETTTESVSTYFSTTTNEVTPFLDKIVTTTTSISPISTTAIQTITEAVLTYSSAFPTEKVMFTDETSTIDAASMSSTTYMETTTDTIDNSSTIIPSEITTALTLEENGAKVWSPADHEIIRSYNHNPADRSMIANTDSVSPRIVHTNGEEPDEKALLNLIPLVIEELKKDNLSAEETETLSEGFGDLWPLMVEESRREPSALMNPKLAVFLFEAGQQLSLLDGTAESLVTDNVE